jgi:hypothetical protein
MPLPAPIPLAIEASLSPLDGISWGAKCTQNLLDDSVKFIEPNAGWRQPGRPVDPFETKQQLETVLLAPHPMAHTSKDTFCEKPSTALESVTTLTPALPPDGLAVAGAKPGAAPSDASAAEMHGHLDASTRSQPLSASMVDAHRATVTVSEVAAMDSDIEVASEESFMYMDARCSQPRDPPSIASEGSLLRLSNSGGGFTSPPNVELESSGSRIVSAGHGGRPGSITTGIHERSSDSRVLALNGHVEATDALDARPGQAGHGAAAAVVCNVMQGPSAPALQQKLSTNSEMAMPAQRLMDEGAASAAADPGHCAVARRLLKQCGDDNAAMESHESCLPHHGTGNAAAPDFASATAERIVDRSADPMLTNATVPPTSGLHHRTPEPRMGIEKNEVPGASSGGCSTGPGSSSDATLSKTAEPGGGADACVDAVRVQTSETTNNLSKAGREACSDVTAPPATVPDSALGAVTGGDYARAVENAATSNLCTHGLGTSGHAVSVPATPAPMAIQQPVGKGKAPEVPARPLLPPMGGALPPLAGIAARKACALSQTFLCHHHPSHHHEISSCQFFACWFFKHMPSSNLAACFVTSSFGSSSCRGKQAVVCCSRTHDKRM